MWRGVVRVDRLQLEDVAKVVAMEEQEKGEEKKKECYIGNWITGRLYRN